MRFESKKLLYDVMRSIELLEQFTLGKTFEDYSKDALLRSGVERQLEIIGEALSKIAKVDSDCALHISEYQKIIALRNILIHEYAQVDNYIVWDILETKLSILRDEVMPLFENEP